MFDGILFLAKRAVPYFVRATVSCYMGFSSLNMLNCILSGRLFIVCLFVFFAKSALYFIRAVVEWGCFFLSINMLFCILFCLR